LDGGRTIRNVAEELGISVSTLRRRHNEYQEIVKEEKKLEEGYQTVTDTFEF